MPALLQRMWTLPKRSMVFCARASTWSCSRNVGLDGDDVAASGSQLGGGVIERGLFDVSEDDVHALGREGVREPAADAAGGAGDDGCLTCEVFHGGSPF